MFPWFGFPTSSRYPRGETWQHVHLAIEMIHAIWRALTVVTVVGCRDAAISSSKPTVSSLTHPTHRQNRVFFLAIRFICRQHKWCCQACFTTMHQCLCLSPVVPCTSMGYSVGAIWDLRQAAGSQVLFIWTPSHLKVRGNAEADVLAEIGRGQRPARTRARQRRQAQLRCQRGRGLVQTSVMDRGSGRVGGSTGDNHQSLLVQAFFLDAKSYFLALIFF